MESGLVGRNNRIEDHLDYMATLVSMESGLVGRNNRGGKAWEGHSILVSMESGLVGRNNLEEYDTDFEAVALSQWSPA